MISLPVNRFVTCLFLVTVLISGYTCRSKDKLLKKGEIIHPRDSGYLFDGRTLKGWEITNFGTQGDVYVSGDKIILGMGDGCTGITWKEEFPTTDYEITLEAMRVNGNDFFCGMTFPVGKDPCSLIVGGWGGTVVGLSSINGMDASENETMLIRQLEKDRWYRIRLRVTGEKIQAWIDDEIVIDFTIGENSLSIRPEVELSKPFGITSWRTTAAIRNIHLAPLLEGVGG
jgi:3-keto-disaccharide hydrolase